MIIFAPERLADCIGEIRDLAPAHYAEVGGYSPDFVQAVDWDAYLEMDRLGVLLSVIARAEGRIVGYWGGAMHRDMHSARDTKMTVMGVPFIRDVVAATQIVFYVVPEWRGAAPAFCRAIERIAANKDISWVAFGAATERTGAFFRRLGYKPGETLWIWVNDHDAVARREITVG